MTPNPFKDLFISYGRRESLGFAGRLHQQLKLAGYDAWFDKVNIPDGDDYQQRIAHGIESAHNFAYIMAPRCMTSPYCLMELEYARLLGKRVIPLNQMVLFETASQELSAGDKQALVNFYQFHNQPVQDICTTEEVLKRSHALIGATDWLAAQHKMSDDDCQRLVEWAQPYENNWAKHENINYLKTFHFQVFGETIDALEGVMERLMVVLERQKNYVHQHTEILTHALHWQKNQKATQHLIIRQERTATEEWLLTEFLPPKQPPCQPTPLIGEFICEARKNAENLMTDIFICNDEQDKEIRNSVIQSLSRYAKTTWIYERDIQKGGDYQRAIEIGLENADNFFYFISPHSVTSDYCQRELAHALQYNKRIVPLLIAPTPESERPDALRGLQTIDFTDNTCQADYDSDIDDILNILRHEHEYYQQHKVLLARALKWAAENRKPSFLLRGYNLENAQTWLRLSEQREQHPPLALHKQFITASEAAKGQLGTEVFVSYSRKDGDFARQLNTQLQEAGKTTWFDQESISTGMDFEKEIFKGIDGADNFLFVLSPDAVESEYCEREVNYAASLGKRFITVLHRETEPNTMPNALRVIQWIDFNNIAFEKSFLVLIQAIELDREHAHQHTVLQQRAVDWAENNRSLDFLLNLTACANAETWRESAPNKQPPSTRLQQEFIQYSRHAITKANRRRNVLLSFATGGMIAAVILAVLAFVKMTEAEQERQKLYKKSDFTQEDAKKLAEQVEKDGEKDGKIFRDSLKDGSKGPEMIWIEAGNFRMGDIQGEGDDDEKPVHNVSIERFAMGRYEVTVSEFRQFVEATGYQTEAEKGYGCWVYQLNNRWKNVADASWRDPKLPKNDDNQPVVCVSWHDAVAYTQWLSTQTGQTYRLPSEAKWEYSARAGKETVFWWRNNIGKNWTNCRDCKSGWDNQLAPVGSFIANPFGLYDTTGNVSEWTADPWHDSYRDAPSDGRVWKEPGLRCLRVIRGGHAWDAEPTQMRVAYRFGRVFSEGAVNSRRVNLGFRLARQARTETEAQKRSAEPVLANTLPQHEARLCQILKETALTEQEAKRQQKAIIIVQRLVAEEGRIFRDVLKDGGDGPKMIWLPAGQFRMGDIQGGGDSDEQPVHPVSIKRVAIGRYEVTVGEFRQFVDATWYQTDAEKDDGCWVSQNSQWNKVADASWRDPKFSQNDNQPVVCVSWNDAMAYTQWLSTQTGHTYRLPTEAQWEYAARAQTTTKYWWGNQIGVNWANCWSCGSQWDGGNGTAPVGSFIANPFGLYDTVGNVWEWTCSEYENSYNDTKNKCINLDSGSLRAGRGGAWSNEPRSVRTANRSGNSPDSRSDFVGFRLARLNP